MKRLVPDEIILGILKYKPAHGYELIDRFKSRAQLGRIWTMSASQVYAVLKRLAVDGVIVGQEINSQDAPTRTEYRVTILGDALLESWLYNSQPSSSIHRIRVEFISRIFIACLLERPCDAIFMHQIGVCEAQKRKVHAEKLRCTSDIEKITLDFVLGQLEAALTWLYAYRSDFRMDTAKYQQAIP
jgi:DNA-binding PadR family transcriptional regulator